MKKTIVLIAALLFAIIQIKAQLISETKTNFNITNATIVVDESECSLVKKLAALLQQDIESVTGKKIPISSFENKTGKNNILLGTITNATSIKKLTAANKFSVTSMQNKWEAYQIKMVDKNLVIAGSDRRGVAYGVFELSKQMGVSPWYWWADVPVKKHTTIYIDANANMQDAPKVKYRGIFINDEAPALSSWSKEKFGGFNHLFYEKVFELLLRLKSNYIWPAMWGNAFYDDDSLNIKVADEYGIVIGTSHHEPLMRAHDEWRRYGSGLWNYDSNATALHSFWKKGMERATNEKIVTVGMRGDGDEPMSRETATTLLENIVKDQRGIIEEVTRKDASETPQLWALYKEVQDYYDKGMRVPDDVTLLLCDDNWGNLRKLPKPDAKPRNGGYGIYYHFDYVGGPRNYKWLNTNPLPRIWEQMHLAYEYNARQIWIVNVGDIKPMEFPISFFLDYAWNPEKIDAEDLKKYSEQWAAEIFGKDYAKEIADLLTKYSKYNGRRKPELLDANTYSLKNKEWDHIVREYNELLTQANQINNKIPPEYKDAFFQLALHPIKASANLNEMYFNVALNKEAFANTWGETNMYADKVRELYKNDSLITNEYHQLNNGKWNHMMSQTHIGYTYWQQPNKQKMPEVKYVTAESNVNRRKNEQDVRRSIIPKEVSGNVFYQEEISGVSIEANHYTKAINSNGITWKVLPDHGRTGSALTPFPVTAAIQTPGPNSPHVTYDFYTYSSGEFILNAYFSPTLNFHNTEEGLQYAVSIDNETPQIISINKEDKNSISGIWNKWVSENIIIKSSKHNIQEPGKHSIKYWMVNPGVVLQKIVLDFGDLEKSYYGPTETIKK